MAPYAGTEQADKLEGVRERRKEREHTLARGETWGEKGGGKRASAEDG